MDIIGKMNVHRVSLTDEEMGFVLKSMAYYIKREIEPIFYASDEPFQILKLYNRLSTGQAHRIKHCDVMTARFLLESIKKV